MTREKEFLVEFRYINTGHVYHEIFRPTIEDTTSPEEQLRERWRGLLCNSGGLRDIISITEIPEKTSK
jgi:hypothetical protein